MRKLFSNTLESVEGNATLADGDPVAVVAELKRLDLVEARTFASRVVHVRHRRRP